MRQILRIDARTVILNDQLGVEAIFLSAQRQDAALARMLHTVFYNIADCLTAPGEVSGKCGLCRDVQLHLLLPQLHGNCKGLQHGVYEVLYLHLFLHKDGGARVNPGNF